MQAISTVQVSYLPNLYLGYLRSQASRLLARGPGDDDQQQYC